MATAKKPAKKKAVSKGTPQRFKILPIERLGDGPHKTALRTAIKLVPSTIAFANALGIKSQSLNRAWGLGRVPDSAILKLAAIAGVLPRSLDKNLYPNKDWTVDPIVVGEKKAAKKKPAEVVEA